MKHASIQYGLHRLLYTKSELHELPSQFGWIVQYGLLQLDPRLWDLEVRVRGHRLQGPAVSRQLPVGLCGKCGRQGCLAKGSF